MESRIRDFASNDMAFEQFSNPGSTLFDWRPVRGPTSDPYPCDLSPCGPYVTDQLMQREFGWKSWDPNTPNWYVGIYSESEIEQDKRYFENWRKQQCRSADATTRQFFISLVSASGTCPSALPEWGAAAGCIASVGGMMDAASSSSAKACHSSYPGPGQWGGE